MPAVSNAAALRGFKAAVTQKLNKAEKRGSTVNAAVNPTSRALEDLQASIDDIEAQQARFNEFFQRIIEAEDDEQAAQSWMDEQAALNKRADDACAALAGLLADKSPPDVAAAAGAAAAPVHGPRCKPNEVLKPDKLTGDHSPVDFKCWKGRFDVYYTSSIMAAASTREQQAYLFACVDVDLDKKIRPYVLPNTPVYSTPTERGCMEMLEDEFLDIHPILLRRINFLKECQKPKQMYGDFVAKLEAQGDEADLAGITPDDLYVLRMIAGAYDDELRTKFLKEVNPTKALLLRMAKEHERAERTNRALGKEAVGVNAAQDKAEGQGRSSDKSSKRASAIRDFVAKLKKEGKCAFCGGSCDRCAKRDELRCSHCDKKGHLAIVCASKALNLPVIPPKQGQKTYAKAVTGDDEGEESASTITIAAVTGYAPTPRIRLKLQHGEKQFSYQCMPDSGASRTIIAHDVAMRHGLQLDGGDRVNIRAANGERMPCEGAVTVNASLGKRTVALRALVSSALKEEILLGWQEMVALGILTKTFPSPINAVTHEQAGDAKALAEEFPEVFEEDRILPMKGEPMKICLAGEVKPTRVLTARQVPVHLQQAAQETLRKVIDSGVIVPVTEPTEWISPAFFVEKPNGRGARMVCDFTGINRFIQRPVHPFPSTQDLLRDIGAGAKFFATLDAVQGYHQIPLDHASSLLTTFLLPSGRYRYTRAPMGLNASSDEWCARSDAALEGLEKTRKIVDDILVWAGSWEELCGRVRSVLERCKQHGITLSRDKMQMGSEVRFAGHVISPGGVEPEPEKVAALKNFPAPADATGLRSFLGLAVQLGGFVPDLAHLTEPLRPLLKKNAIFLWLPEHEEAFARVKDALTSPLVVRFFDPKLPTELLTDASRLKGLGYALIQRDDGGMRLIKCGSRSLSPAETRYATIELEALAIHWAITSCRFYLTGGPKFKVVTDHKPLIPMFTMPLGDVENARVLRYREKTTQLSFEVVWSPGKNHEIADALSRAPVFDPPEEEEACLVCSVQAEDPILQDLYDAAEDDAEYQKVKEAWENGREPRNLPFGHPARLFNNVWNGMGLTPDRALLTYNGRLIIPTKLRRNALAALHKGHGGITKTRKLAQDLYFWPGINNQVKMMIDSCDECQEGRASQPREADQSFKPPALPWEVIATDPFEFGGKDYLLVTDVLSGYPFVVKMGDKTTRTILRALEELCMAYGFPREIISDNGRQFLREFEEWCEEKFIIHKDRKSSPYNHEANGHAEAGVKAMKALLDKTGGFGREFAEALLHYRNLPRSDGRGSPAELFFGRRQRRGIPEPQHVQGRGLRDERESSGEGKKTLPPLSVGDAVRLQNPLTGRWDAVGVVTGRRSTGRSYFVQRQGESKNVLRNRRFLKPLPASEAQPDGQEVAKASPPPSVQRRSPRLQAQAQHGSREVQAAAAQRGGGRRDVEWLSCV
jgi:hypothetical protein